MEPTPEILNPSPDCLIETIRTIHAPVKKVYKAWTDPLHLANWWGPHGFTNTIHEFDLRPGGKWRLTMHGPEKGNYENESVFLIVEEPTRLVWNRVSQPLFQVVVIFEALKEQETKLIFRMIFHDAATCNKIKPFAPEKNEENMDRLEAELNKMK